MLTSGHHVLLLFVTRGVGLLLVPFLNLSNDHEERDTCKGAQKGSAPGRPTTPRLHLQRTGLGTLTAEQRNANEDAGGGHRSHVAAALGRRVTVAQLGAVANPHWVGEQERRRVLEDDGEKEPLGLGDCEEDCGREAKLLSDGNK